VAFYTANGISPQELWDKLNCSDLPKLWIPKRENLHPLESIPILGSGKADLKKVKELALERSGEPA
jgi:acyl-[acyl-carrier-protein]-phospholipid O-acyltransferase/long-chain-fatty-acid--[acyl-carrier-protein] ligase